MRRSVILIGDSHVRRLKEAGIEAFFLERNLNLICYYKGGAKVNNGDLQVNLPQADIAVVMIGSNDLDVGVPANSLLSLIMDRAMQLLRTRTVKHVIIMGQWPRRSRWFNNRSRYFNGLGKCLKGRKDVTFWQWSKKLTIKLSSDGVHGIPRVYERAVRYVASAVFWVTKTKLQIV